MVLLFSLFKSTICHCLPGRFKETLSSKELHHTNSRGKSISPKVSHITFIEHSDQ